MRAATSLASLVLAALASPGACSAQSPCTPGAAGADVGDFPQSLSAYCMVSIESGAVVPKPGVVPYDLNTPLFSDYTTKFRTVWLPPGASVTYTATGRLELPVGSVVTKSFGFPADARSATSPVSWAETRVMVRGPAGWKGTSYLWDDKHADAQISVGGEILDATFIGTEGQTEQPNYLVPSQSQCHKCHDDAGVMDTLGPSAEQLNRVFAYATSEGGSENELAHWARIGILKGAPAPARAPVLPVWSDPTTGDVTARARAYLQANCAYCHDGSGGEARTSGLVLTGTETDPQALGICKTPIAAGRAAEGEKYDVVPGHPEQSILIYRVTQTVPSLAMPELGRSLEHVEGVALLSDWVTQLQGSCP
jgi:uncharacterized repeat protein (TIGR03806 family)